ncbi:MAG: hypothetical protein J6M62_04185 [Selenomonadaceae bacterium]|nr:hypothetical protein [Selenomonadaceae bacterium]
MVYETLKKIYYTAPLKIEDVYQSRYNAPFTRHFPFDIKQINRKNKYPAFLCYTEEIVFLIEKIYKNYETFLYKVNSVPPVVLHQFALTCIIDEVKATNDIIRIISDTFEDVIEILSRKMAQLDKYKEKLFNIISSDELNQNLYFILLQASLFYGQGVSMQDLMEITGKSRNTIKSRLLAMPKEHIVIRKTKTHYYKLNMFLFK